MTLFNLLKQFINSKNINDIISRQEIIQYFKDNNLKIEIFTTLDYYRNILTERTHYLEMTDKRGFYKINKYIESDLTGNKLRILYDSLR